MTSEPPISSVCPVVSPTCKQVTRYPQRSRGIRDRWVFCCDANVGTTHDGQTGQRVSQDFDEAARSDESYAARQHRCGNPFVSVKRFGLPRRSCGGVFCSDPRRFQPRPPSRHPRHASGFHFGGEKIWPVSRRVHRMRHRRDHGVDEIVKKTAAVDAPRAAAANSRFGPAGRLWQSFDSPRDSGTS